MLCDDTISVDREQIGGHEVTQWVLEELCVDSMILVGGEGARTIAYGLVGMEGMRDAIWRCARARAREEWLRLVWMPSG